MSPSASSADHVEGRLLRRVVQPGLLAVTQRPQFLVGEPGRPADRLMGVPLERRVPVRGDGEDRHLADPGGQRRAVPDRGAQFLKGGADLRREEHGVEGAIEPARGVGEGEQPRAGGARAAGDGVVQRALLVVEIRGGEYGQSGHGLQCAGAPLPERGRYGADWFSRELARRAGAVVVSVDYRLCNDGVHYPVPHDDVVAAIRWARDSASELGIDPGQVSAGGASAGRTSPPGRRSGSVTPTGSRRLA